MAGVSYAGLSGIAGASPMEFEIGIQVEVDSMQGLPGMMMLGSKDVLYSID